VAEPGAQGQFGKIRDLMRGYLEEHGARPEGVGFPGEDRHKLRFDKLADIVDTKDPFTVNDWGCGYAALFKHLVEERALPVSRYNGYDISPEAVEHARRFTGDDARVHLYETATLTETADYSFASGTFANIFDGDVEEWRQYVEQSLRTLAEKSSRGFAVNFFSTYVDWQEPHLYYADPAYYFDFAKRELSRYVSVVHDYPLWEWTLIVRTAVD
jgi:SAM-dependent methyltransferase